MPAETVSFTLASSAWMEVAYNAEHVTVATNTTHACAVHAGSAAPALETSAYVVVTAARPFALAGLPAGTRIFARALAANMTAVVVRG